MCKEAKSGTIHHIQRPVRLADGIGEHFHIDIAYVFSLRFLEVVEAVTLYTVAELMPSKSEPALREKLLTALGRFEVLGYNGTKTIFSDGEKSARAMAEALLRMGIDFNSTGAG